VGRLSSSGKGERFGWTRTTAFVVLALVVVGLVVLDLCYAFSLPGSQEKLRQDVLGLLVPLAAGIAGLAALLTFMETRRQNLESKELTRVSLDLTRRSQTMDRFSKAIEQLGSRQRDVCVGAIYTLEQIARDSPDMHWPIMEIFTTYLHEHAGWVEASPTEHESSAEADSAEQDGSARDYPRPSADIQAIATVLGRRTRANDAPMRNIHGVIRYQGKLMPVEDLSEEQRTEVFRGSGKQPLDLSKLRLQNVLLENARLQHADLNHSHLEGAKMFLAYLQEADCRGTYFHYTDLNNVHMQKANLYGAHLDHCSIREAHLEEARLLGADLSHSNLGYSHLEKAILGHEHLDSWAGYPARLCHAFLYEAHLEGAFLRGADLTSANLGNAHLSGAFMLDANLEGADLAGADLTEAHELTREQLLAARNPQEAKLPAELQSMLQAEQA
jgi:uncharacterized protein YjbI with pentapeptide repeats